MLKFPIKPTLAINWHFVSILTQKLNFEPLKKNKIDISDLHYFIKN